MNIKELKRLAESAKKAHGGLPWQITMARHDGVTHYHVRGHCEPAIAVVPHEYWEDNYEPPVDDYGYFQPDERMDCDPVRVDIARYIAAANPAAILELIRQLQAAREILPVLKGLVADIQGLMSESHGVTGLHLNGDVAPWGELEPGGQFERLGSLQTALELIIKTED